MQNLRILGVQIIDNSNIDIKFTSNLTSNLITSNISIISEITNVPNSSVLEIKINENILSIICQPLTPLADYTIILQSVSFHPFISVNGDAKISEDGVSNKVSIVGPIESNNPVKNFLNNFLKDNIYDVENSDTLVSKYIDSLSVNLSKALYDIGQVKNENYLSFTVLDEQHTRGTGPFDRLNEESVYEIIRVGKTLTSANAENIFLFDIFPTFPITLQKKSGLETFMVSSSDNVGTFNINNLTFNFENSPITKVTSIIFTFETANPIYVYDIEKLGYQINNSRYDQDFSFTYLLLSDNQIRINDKVLEDPNFSLENIFKIDVIYEYKNLGIVVDANSVIASTILKSTREELPPIINVFNLEHAPIVDSNNNIFNFGGIIFTDPNNIAGSTHPAFVVELPFRLNALPSSIGQYSIDYATGTVYVFGATIDGDGTGPFPPLATYNYRFIYKSQQDYVYDSDLLDLIALPNGNLINQAGAIAFSFEEVLIPGVDYVADLHQESLSERIGNKLLALNVLKTQNSPITSVFKIFNETSGEIYTVDRWNDNKVYFRFNNPPRIEQQIAERGSFSETFNEILFVNTTLINAGNLKIFKIFLSKNTLISSTEDSIASSFNTSLFFSFTNIFNKEKWFNRKFNENDNINRLINIGEYTVDYINGIIYCAISNTQNFNLGTVNYKNNLISIQFPHIISVDDIYCRISPLNSKNKQFSFISFDDGIIEPETPDFSDELFLNNNDSGPYQLLDGYIGTFIDSEFISGVTNQVKFIRSIYEYQDLLTSTHPLNFAESSFSSEFNIVVSPIDAEIVDSVQFDGTNYFVIIDKNVPFLSPNITYDFSVARSRDGALLWNSSGTIVPGDTIKLILPGINSPVAGDIVVIKYLFIINSLSRIAVDYNKGDYFIDYTYLADEILVSYEFGDNVLDFRKSNISENTTYYASYKVGALRDALLKNFGTLVNVPILANVNLDFNRERYRDALIAALTSFIQGPTISAIKNIGKTISHIEPEIIESAFQSWSLGSSLLNPEAISTSGSFQLLPAKYNKGVLINSDEQSITFPTSSNIRLEEGTFESWIIPQWNGIDNDAKLTFNITIGGSPVDASIIFIGGSEYHPVLSNNQFTLDKNSNVSGSPNKNKDGIFIFYDKDISGNFMRWYIEIIDGYMGSGSAGYNFNISSDGTFYDVKSLSQLKPSNMTIFTGVSNVTFTISSGGSIDEGITFISDVDHYLLDFGEDKSNNRLSIFKDVSGYVNFRVFDKDKVAYIISSNISSWKINEAHHVAASWKINTKNNKDELHLFIDGLEVPNIIKYGQKLNPYLHEKFRTINPEQIIGLSTRDIVGSVDLQTVAGSNKVTSSINFNILNIFSGDIIFIDEIGFNTNGYTINSISGQSLILNSNMPITLNDGRFSINRTSFTTITDINIVPNIVVTTVHSILNGNDLSGSINSVMVTSGTTNFSTNNILPGYLIRIENVSLSKTYNILQVIGHSLVIDDNLVVGISNATFHIYPNIENEIPGVRALRPSYSISNNILTISNNVKAADLILVKTLGINNRLIKKEYYVWSDGYENILMSRLPPPISLDDTNIIKIILPTVSIGTSNSTLISGIFHSSNLTTSQPTNTQIGRTITITLSGTNVDFSTHPQITINGISNSVTISETISFTDYGSIDFSHQYTSINYISAIIKPINNTKNAANILAREKYSITHSESNEVTPIIRYSYQISDGVNLQGQASTVTDNFTKFSSLDLNNYLIIQSPPTVAGFYKINSLSVDRSSLNITSSIPLSNFSNGVYKILNVNSFRSGLQNGFFTFEDGYVVGEPYFLSHGFYDLEYSTYISIKLNTLKSKVYLGSDFSKKNHVNAIIDQVKIYSVMLSDTRIGETIPSNQHSITKDFNSLKPLTKDSNTLMLLDFDSFPFVNTSDFYIMQNNIKNHFQSSVVVNENFGNSLMFLDEPLIVSNDGILDTKKEGTIEFWINPLFDTGNDPNTRFYFDAFGATIQEAVSVNNVSVKLSSPASKILSVKVKNGDPNIDYFVGGKLEIDTQRALSEEIISLSNNSVMVSKNILQIITVKIVDDLTEIDYFANGTIGSDNKTIYLGKTLPSNNLPLIVTYQTTENNNHIINTQIIRLNKKLPYQNTQVIINYIPKGLQGDRLSIFKDNIGFMNFSILSSSINHIIKVPIKWIKGTWHRVKASYKMNGGIGQDEMRLFLDGYEYTDLSPDINFAAPGDGYEQNISITFKDSINDLYIGTQYTKESPIFSLIDNFRISNISRPIYAPFGESLDVNYNTNLDIVFPVTHDLYTTYILDFDSLLIKNIDFATLKNRKTGLSDFSINIFDSFDIISENIKSKESLEALIKTLKPASSRAFISYIK